MGSATTQATSAATTALDAASSIDLDVARELFAAARTIDGSSQLSGAIADSAASTQARVKVIADVFGRAVSAQTLELLTSVVQQRWSSASDLIDGIEDLAVRAATVASPDADIEEELFRFSRAVADNAELELALGSRRGEASAKATLVTTLLSDRASAATTLIASSLAQQPRERRIRRVLTHAMRIVADQRGRKVATIVSAVPLNVAQRERLATALSQKYGTAVSLNTLIDPSVIGGLRVQIADDVIDASVSSRLSDLRQKLAG